MTLFRERITAARKMLSMPVMTTKVVHDQFARTVRIFLELEDHTVVEAEVIEVYE